MTRNLRIHIPTAIYHVMVRGNDGQNIFFSDTDRLKCCFLLQEGLERFDHRIHGFCLMSNHIHLIVQTGNVTLSKIMHHFSSRYVNLINYNQGRKGHLFQGRFKSIYIDALGYLSELSRYIHLNPVRAGLVSKPENYVWSSYRDFLGGFDSLWPWVWQERILRKFHSHDLTARKLYQNYVNQGIGIPISPETYHHLCEGAPFKEDQYESEYLEELQEWHKKPIHNKPVLNRISIPEIVNLVAKKTNQSLSELQSDGKRSNLA